MHDPQEPQPLDMRQVAMLNNDLLQRLTDEGVTFTYDEDGDSLFLTIGPGVAALTEHIVYGIYVRIEPESLRIVGIDILQFKNRFLVNNELFKVMFEEDFNRMRSQGGIAVIEGENAKRLYPLFDAMLAR